MGIKDKYYDGYEHISSPSLFTDKTGEFLSDILNSGEPGDNVPESRVTLRRSMTSDIQFIGRLSGDVFKIYGPYDEILPAWFKSGNDITTIIACLGKIQIGFAMLSKPSDMYDLQDVSELLGIAVKPERQGIGVGEMLLRAIETKSATLNIKWVFLHTAVNNMPARRLYERTGYRNLEIKKCFYPKGQDAIVMYKPVKRIF